MYKYHRMVIPSYRISKCPDIVRFFFILRFYLRLHCPENKKSFAVKFSLNHYHKVPTIYFLVLLLVILSVL